MLESLLNVNFFGGGLLFAQRNTVGRLPAPTASSTAPMLIGLGLGALVVMALIAVVIQYRQRRHAKGTLNSPTELWAELCRVHQLDKTDSAALRELAEARAMDPAAKVFVRADLWQLERDADQVRHVMPVLPRLQGILFAEPKAPKVVKL